MLYDNNPTINDLRVPLPDSVQGSPYTAEAVNEKSDKHFYIESYGCAMNFADSEIVASILGEIGYSSTREMEIADLILINTCSIREKAEETVRKRLRIFDKQKRRRPGTLIGVLGCMAERLKKTFLDEEKLVDMVIGPDAYRDLPALISNAHDGEKGVNVFLSREETYADISPVRLDESGVLAFISIMRGCDNMCSFCVVPYTRGRERSREPFSVVAEATDLFQRGYREVTLLVQNVDSYKWSSDDKTVKVNFAELLRMVAAISPLLRVRFSTSHPKDITDEVIETIAGTDNICNYIHLPVQSGNSRILALMNRTYDADWYKNRVDKIYEIMPDCTISADIITGFCSENEEDHKDTLEIIKYSKFTMSYTYYYSERPGTLAARKYEDDVPLEIKKRRLAEVIEVQRQLSYELNLRDIGKTYEVLVEGFSKKSQTDLKGRNSQNKMLVFPSQEGINPGDYVCVKVTKVSSATLLGEITSQHQ